MDDESLQEAAEAALPPKRLDTMAAAPPLPAPFLLLWLEDESSDSLSVWVNSRRNAEAGGGGVELDFMVARSNWQNSIRFFIKGLYNKSR